MVAPGPADVRLLEQAEIDGMADMYRAAAPPFAAAHRIRFEQRGPLAAFAAGAFDVLALNRIAGAGLEPLDAQTLDAAVDLVRSLGAPRVFVSIAPGAHAPAAAEALTARGFHLRNHWIKLQRGVEDPPEPAQATELTIARVHAAQALAFGGLVASCFGWPGACGRWVAATVGLRGWMHFGAFDGDELVGAGALRVEGHTGWLGLAATLDRARGRGAQSALIVERIRAARAAGCTRLVVETAQPHGGNRAPSYRNATRLGFTVAYERPNYEWP
jgi:GNAT superfamily N-acetyltransferase